jgi:hypothetical protein
LSHNDSKIHDGFGDTAFAFKYPLASGNKHHEDLAGRINHETMGVKDSKEENEFLADAEDKIAHDPLNGIKKWGSKVQKNASLVSPAKHGTGYESALQIVWRAIQENNSGIDPTRGANL